MSQRANPEIANIWIGYIFAKLYESFPVPYDFTVSEIVRETKETPNLNEYELALFGSSLIDWLQKEGFIRGEAPPLGPDFLIDFATLTERGFRILNAVPQNLKEKKKVGQRLVEASKDIGQDAVKKTVGDLVGQVFGGIIKGVAS
jgi:hypothetical protein